MDGPELFYVKVEVSLREGIADPQGATIERALPALGFDGVSSMRAGKAFRFAVAANDRASALTRAGEVADRLLANPVIEEYAVSLLPDRAATVSSAAGDATGDAIGHTAGDVIGNATGRAIGHTAGTGS